MNESLETIAGVQSLNLVSAFGQRNILKSLNFGEYRRFRRNEQNAARMYRLILLEKTPFFGIKPIWNLLKPITPLRLLIQAIKSWIYEIEDSLTSYLLVIFLELSHILDLLKLVVPLTVFLGYRKIQKFDSINAPPAMEPFCAEPECDVLPCQEEIHRQRTTTSEPGITAEGVNSNSMLNHRQAQINL